MVLGAADARDATCPNLIFDGIHHWVSPVWTAYLVSSILIFSHALLINRMVIKHRLSKELTQIPGMMYALICSIFLGQLDLYNILLANTFLILALQQLFNLNKHPRPSIPLSLAGFFTAIAAILYFPYTLLLLISISAIHALRSIGIRSILQYLLSFLGVFIILISYLIWNEQLAYFFYGQWFANLSIQFDFLEWETFDWFRWSIVVLVQIIFVLFYNEFIKKKGLAARKKISLLFQWQALCLVCTMMVCSIEPASVAVLAISSSIFFTMLFLTSKNKFIYEILHFVCLALVLNNQFNFYPLNFLSLF